MVKFKPAKIVVPILIILLLAIAGVNAIVSVPTGHTGVVVTFGKVEDYVLTEGMHLKLPWQTVVKMDNRVQKNSVALQAFSSDIQQVNANVAVNYSVDRETSQNLYRNVGSSYYSTVMEPRIQENVKSVFSKFSAENLVASREDLSRQVSELLKPEMKAHGIEIISVSIEDIDFTDVFTDAVEAKQVAEQSKLQATIEQEQKIIEAEAQAERAVISAEAEASVRKIDADAAAYAIQVQAEAEAEANKKIAASLTDELIAYTEMTTWDGVLPKIYSGGNGSVIPVLGADLLSDTTEESE